MILPSTDSSALSRPISRRQALRRGALLAGGALFTGSLLSRLAAQPPSTLPANSVDRPDHPIAKMREGIAGAPLEVVRLSDRHAALVGHGGNIGVYVGASSLLVVDSGSGRAPATEKLRSTLQSLSNLPLRYLVNTHWHFDHTDGNANLHAAGATIIAHRVVRERLSSPQTIAFFNARFEASARDAIPELTFNDELDLDLGSDVVRVKHVPPAHTDSDSFVYWPKANVVQTGDIYFSNTFPFIDGSSGGSLAGMIHATETVLAVCNGETKIIPGHGAIAGKKELTATLSMLKTVQERLGRLKASGKSVDEIVAAKPIDDLQAQWGQGMINAEAFVRVASAAP